MILLGVMSPTVLFSSCTKYASIHYLNTTDCTKHRFVHACHYNKYKAIFESNFHISQSGFFFMQALPTMAAILSQQYLFISDEGLEVWL